MTRELTVQLALLLRARKSRSAALAMDNIRDIFDIPNDYRVYQNRRNYLVLLIPLGAIVTAWIVGAILAADRLTNWWSVAVIPGAVLPFGGYIVYVSLQKDPLLGVSQEVLFIRSGMLPWRKLQIDIDDIVSVRGQVDGGGQFNDLVVRVVHPLDPNTPRVWRLRYGSIYYFDLGGADTSVESVAANVARFIRLKSAHGTKSNRHTSSGGTVTSALVAIFNLMLALAFFVLALAWGKLPPAFQSTNILGASLISASVCAIAFGRTYRNLGPDTDPDRPLPVGVSSRGVQMQQACPTWRVVWYGSASLIPAAIAISAILGLSVEPFLTFVSMAHFVTGMWFLVAYPVARHLLGE